jgi:uncharacterized protein DUF4382
MRGIDMQNHLIRYAVSTTLIAALAACGGGSGSSSAASTTPAPTQQSGTVPLIVSDASSDDWAMIGVKVLSIALIPQGGGSNVTVYTAPSPAPYVNLEQLDQLGEILGNVSVPVGTYTGALITISGNPGDVMLTTSAAPEAGFALAAATQVPTADIYVTHTQGSAPNLTVPVSVNFVSPLVVTTTSSSALDLEFDLSHPAFIVGHMPPGASATQWAVNFTGPVRHHPLADLRRLVLRHTYGSVTGISSDNTSITITKDYATLPAVSPETAIASSQSLTILADATNGTLLYDVDTGTVSTIMNFSSESSLNGEYVRIAARYQEDGTLVATRIWASTSFNKVWLSPEGHVLNVNTNTNVITVTNEDGVGVPLQILGSTQFFFRQPWNAVADATPIGTGTTFLADQDIVRGFKVHVSAVDPLATLMQAQTVDIETADYSGAISQPSTTGFTYTHDFLRVIDDYNLTLTYINSGTANGNDPLTGKAITGYKWWDFAYPTVVDSIVNSANPVADFVAATNGTVSFGGTAAPIIPWGISYCLWGDPANTAGWSAAASILEPTPLPIATVQTAPTTPASGNVVPFTITVAGGASAVTVNASTVSGSATLVYQVDYSGGVVTVSPIDITTSAGLTSFEQGMATGTVVEVAGVPQQDSTVKAYVVTYFTNTTPVT